MLLVIWPLVTPNTILTLAPLWTIIQNHLDFRRWQTRLPHGSVSPYRWSLHPRNRVIIACFSPTAGQGQHFLFGYKRRPDWGCLVCFSSFVFSWDPAQCHFESIWWRVWILLRISWGRQRGRMSSKSYLDIFWFSSWEFFSPASCLVSACPSLHSHIPEQNSCPTTIIP